MATKHPIQSTQLSRGSAQDQESDKLKSTKSKSPIKAKSTSFDQSKAKGRPIAPSRLGAHPYAKQRKPKAAIRSTAPLPKAQTQIVRQSPVRGGLGKTSQQVASVAHTSHPKPKQSVSKEAIQNRLKKKSPWFDSIMSPITGGGVKIPDPVGTETGTYQHVENVSVKVNANGIAGLRIISPYVNGFVTANAPDGLNYQVTSSPSSIANLFWGSTAGVPNDGFSFKQVAQLMKANARTHRIVSASVLAQPEISTLNDAGEMTSFVTPFSTQTNAVDYATYQFQYDSTLVPINVHKPVVARWYPLQSDTPLCNGLGPISGHQLVVSYQDFIDPNFNAEDGTGGVIPWEFGVVCSGMQPSTGLVRFQMVLNYEFIPLMSTAMVSAAASPVDEVEETLVNTWVSESPLTEVVSQKFASQAQQVSRISEDSEPTGLGMLFNVIEEVIPVAKLVGGLF